MTGVILLRVFAPCPRLSYGAPPYPGSGTPSAHPNSSAATCIFTTRYRHAGQGEDNANQGLKQGKESWIR
jgi:hypothetical protein